MCFGVSIDVLCYEVCVECLVLLEGVDWLWIDVLCVGDEIVLLMFWCVDG